MDFSILLRINGSKEIPLESSPAEATTPFEATVNIIHRTNSNFPENSWFVSRVDSLSFLVIGPGGLGE